jgi:hypothetical protein
MSEFNNIKFSFRGLFFIVLFFLTFSLNFHALWIVYDLFAIGYLALVLYNFSFRVNIKNTIFLLSATKSENV